MSFWILLQVIVNIVLIAGVVGLWIRVQKPAKDDPRLSRGLQLLQSKISVLEDLSDRTETQVSQLTALLEHKAKEIQTQILSADKSIQKVESSMAKSLEVAQIFQDKIPHQEIIERQQTMKYVKAARLAHQGASVDDIAAQVDLSRGEIEFIAKVNRDQLQFSEEALPEWAKEELNQAVENEQTASEARPQVFEQQPLAKSQDQVDVRLSELGNKFRQATTGTATAGTNTQTDTNSTAPVLSATAPSAPATKPAEETTFYAQTTAGKNVTVKKVVFPKVQINNNLT